MGICRVPTPDPHFLEKIRFGLEPFKIIKSLVLLELGLSF
jgi:hypothetical protein